MLFVISPAKKLDLSEETRYTLNHSEPALLNEAETLVGQLSGMKAEELGKLMHISPQLSELNYERYQTFSVPFTPENAKQAILSFNGDVYQSLELDQYGEAEFAYAQEHLRILSGLYGLLKPLDLMQPYRLEMGTRLKNSRGKDLYAFWGNTITQGINAVMEEQGSEVLINLASNEYFKSVRAKEVKARIITPLFKEEKNGSFRTISFFAKQARGAMVNFAIRERLISPEQLKDFTGMDYAYQEGLSDEDTWIFTR
ncbi:MAG: peroxide stress protein YaaA [Bacteroidota bacterium]